MAHGSRTSAHGSAPWTSQRGAVCTRGAPYWVQLEPQPMATPSATSVQGWGPPGLSVLPRDTWDVCKAAHLHPRSRPPPQTLPHRAGCRGHSPEEPALGLPIMPVLRRHLCAGRRVPCARSRVPGAGCHARGAVCCARAAVCTEPRAVPVSVFLPSSVGVARVGTAGPAETSPRGCAARVTGVSSLAGTCGRRCSSQSPRPLASARPRCT